MVDTFTWFVLGIHTIHISVHLLSYFGYLHIINIISVAISKLYNNACIICIYVIANIQADYYVVHGTMLFLCVDLFGDRWTFTSHEKIL